MEIHYYDSYASKVEIYRKFASLHSFIHLVDSIQIIDNSAWATVLTADIRAFSDEKIIELSMEFFEKVPETLEIIKFMKETFPFIKKLRSEKHKPRQSILLIENFNIGIKHFKSGFEKDKKGFSDNFMLTELLPFIDQKIWQINALDFMINLKKEDIFIQPISKSIIEGNAILGLDTMIEEFFSFINYDSPENTGFDFIKIPLWHIPVTENLNNAQINHSRNHLQPALATFKTHLKELSEEIFPLSFSPEHIPAIKQLIHNKLKAHISPIQQSIDENLYFCQAKKQFSEIFGTTLYLGIASADTIISYFEKTETILPYVASEIKHLVSKQFDVSSSMVFSYFEMNIPDISSEND